MFSLFEVNFDMLRLFFQLWVASLVAYPIIWLLVKNGIPQGTANAIGIAAGVIYFIIKIIAR